MKIKYRNILFRLALMTALLPGSFYLSAQEDKIDAILDSMFFSNDEEILLMFAEMNRNHHFLYTRIGYDSKTTYAGREIGTEQYNLTGQLFYINSLGFNIGVSGAWYSQMYPSYRSTVVTAGYSNGLKKNKWLRYRISYNRYFYNINDSDYEPVYTGSAAVGISLKAGPVGSRMDYSLLLGKEYGSQVSADLYGNSTLLKIGKRAKIRILPEISFYFGSETVEYERYSYLDGSMQSPGDAEPVYEDKFGLMNTQLSLPLEFSIGDLDIEVAYIYNLNRSIDPDYTFDNVPVISFSVGYFFMLK
ncbi:MAG TPA: hypothetical protein ENH59_01120 [Bacteroidetes bacterium]|nr:hypothetical protein [Bacteroidota bacterium]